MTLFFIQLTLRFCEFHGVIRLHTIDCEINKKLLIQVKKLLSVSVKEKL